MRRFLIAPLAAATLVGAMALPVAARGPACVDLLSANSDNTVQSRASYNGELVAAQIVVAGTQCRQATYTLYVLDNEGDSTPIAVVSAPGDGSDTTVEIFAEATVSDGDVCVYVESSIGRRVFDRAPSDGCVTLLDDGTSPGGGKGF